MDISRLVSEFSGLPSAAQIQALTRLAFELTIVARETYEPGSLELRRPRWLRSLNEVQHTVTSHLLALLAGGSRRYPDEVLVAIILEQDDPELRRQIAAAFTRGLPSQAVA